MCNLGSINLEKFDAACDVASVNITELAKVVGIATRMLDNVIDLSEYPVPRLEATRRANRRLGLGVMGFADLLAKKRIGYNTAEARAVAECVMSTVNDFSHAMSTALAYEKGVFSNWGLSKYAAKGELRRNAATTTVAPTGTISMMYDVCGGIEPFFALAYYYDNILGGDVKLQYVNKHLRAALEAGSICTPDLMEKIIRKGSLAAIEEIPPEIRTTFVTSMDISAEEHIAQQAAFQKHCDNSISKTINFPNAAWREDCARGYSIAWESGCKGCTVYRDGSRFMQVLNLNEKKDADPEQHDAAAVCALAAEPRCPDCTWALSRSEGCMLCVACGYSACERE